VGCGPGPAGTWAVYRSSMQRSIGNAADRADGAATSWLRNNDPVFWYERDNVEPFWAITKHADIIAIGKRPDLFLNAPRLAVFTPRICRRRRRARRGICSTWTRPTTRATARHQWLVHAARHHGNERQGRARHPRRPRRRREEELRRLRRRHLGAHHHRRHRRDARRAQQDWDKLFRWTNEIIAPQDPEFQQGDGAGNDRGGAPRAVRYFTSSPRSAAGARPATSSASSPTAGQRRAAATVELLSYYFLLVVAGNETTRNAMTGGMLAMLENPGSGRSCARAAAGRRRRRGDRALDDAGDPVRPHRHRDHELRGKTIRGRSGLSLLRLGNRDEEVFADPFVFRIDRQPNPHIGFGMGEHVCLGAHLARLELKHAFSQLARRLEACELSGPIERARSSFVGGIKRAPMRWVAMAPGPMGRTRARAAPDGRPSHSASRGRRLHLARSAATTRTPAIAAIRTPAIARRHPSASPRVRVPRARVPRVCARARVTRVCATTRARAPTAQRSPPAERAPRRRVAASVRIAMAPPRCRRWRRRWRRVRARAGKGPEPASSARAMPGAPGPPRSRKAPARARWRCAPAAAAGCRTWSAPRRPHRPVRAARARTRRRRPRPGAASPRPLERSRACRARSARLR
jgi:hypothetical protein